MDTIVAILQSLGKIIDLILIVVILICVWSGYKKGLIMGVGGILVIIVSVFGGHLLSNVFSYEVIPALKPFASGYMEEKVTGVVYDKLGIDEEVGTVYSLEDLIAQNPGIEKEVCAGSFKSVGIYDSASRTLADRALLNAEMTGDSLKESIVIVLCDTIVYVGGFTLFFLIIVITLTVVGNVLNISFKLPGLDLVNDISGAAIGLLTGFMFCAVIAWALKFLGIIVSEESMEKMKLASWLIEKDYLARFLGL